MNRAAQALLSIIATSLSGTALAVEPTGTKDVQLHLPVIGYVSRGLRQLFTQASPDMKYVVPDSGIQETAAVKVVGCRAILQEQGFFSRCGTPRIISFDAERVKTTVFELPRYRPVLVVPGQKPMWTTVWGKPLHDVPLIVPASEAEGRVELWDLYSLTRVLDIRDKNFYSDVIGPLQKCERLVASQAGNRLAWLTAEGDIHVWDLQTRTPKWVILSHVAGPCAESPLQGSVGLARWETGPRWSSSQELALTHPRGAAN